jgi:hypothetical protein
MLVNYLLLIFLQLLIDQIVVRDLVLEIESQLLIWIYNPSTK